MSTEALARATFAPATLTEALVTEVLADARLSVRLLGPADTLPERGGTARVALPGYAPSAGDRVLVSPASAPGDGYYVVGVLKAARAPSLATPSRATASVEGDTIVVRDAAGAVAVVFDAAAGTARVSAPSGDLVLSAPQGRVVLEAATDVALRAPRDVTVEAGRRIAQEVTAGEGSAKLTLSETTARVTAGAFALETKVAHVETTEGTLVAERLATRATQIATVVGRWELKAKRLVERVQDAYRDVEGLSQTRAGRLRAIVKDTFQTVARKTSIASKDDTVIDGKRVLLG